VNFFLKKLDGYKVMTEMSKREIKQFLMRGTFTAKLATVKGDGGPHIVPIWFVLDNQKD
jgi:nitroimidazol reductase NimA-like FMN-containing flavoprotein (pyridoxamine 5'-phosphate oxidase superfamily)